MAVRTLFGSGRPAGVTRPTVGDGVALVVEADPHLLLVTVILGTADRHRVVGTEAAIAVGATIAACGLIALPIDRRLDEPGSIARTGPRRGDLRASWIYVVGPAVGAILAVILTRFLHGLTAQDAEAVSAAQGG